MDSRLMKFTASDIGAKFRLAFDTDMRKNIAHAATSAMRAAGDMLKVKARSNIGAAGFSKRWQNAWRVNIYPAAKESINAAAFGFHKIPYSLAFEEGATIRGKSGLLWLPLRTTPRVGKSKPTPKLLAAKGVKLFAISRPGKLPLLASNVRQTEAQRAAGAVSLTKLRRGAQGKRGKVSAVPLFVGVSQVTLRKRFNVSGIAKQIASKLGALYFSKVKA